MTSSICIDRTRSEHLEEEDPLGAEHEDGQLLRASAVDSEERAPKKARKAIVDIADKVNIALNPFDRFHSRICQATDRLLRTPYYGVCTTKK
jgi:hypothetical protein